MSNISKKNNLFSVFIIFVALVLSFGIISIVHNFTTKRFENSNYIVNLETLMKVMSGNYEFVLLNDSIFSSLKQNKLKVYKAIDEGIIEGYCVDITVDGINGEINLVTGISHSGVINDTEILFYNESPTFGSKVFNDEYLDKFKGLNYPMEFSNEVIGLNAISGATITSNTVKDALNIALKAILLAKESEGLN